MHRLGPTNAVAMLRAGSRLNHSCDANTAYTSSPDGAHAAAVHVATRAIAEGKHLTSNYLGSETSVGTRTRQHVLRRKKLFSCRCSRCLGPDLCSAVPCPGCHPRDSNGHLPLGLLAAHVHYAMAGRRTEGAAAAGGGGCAAPGRDGDDGDDDGGDVRWHCSWCSRSFDARLVFPAISSAARLVHCGGPGAVYDPASLGAADPLEGMEAEARLCEAVYDLGVRSASSLETIEGHLRRTAAQLGERHWATVWLLHARCRLSSGRMIRGEVATADLPAALEALLHACEQVWALCVAARLSPDSFGALGSSLDCVLDRFEHLPTAVWLPASSSLESSEGESSESESEESDAEDATLIAAADFARTLLLRQLACCACTVGELTAGYLASKKRHLLEQLARIDRSADGARDLEDQEDDPATGTAATAATAAAASSAGAAAQRQRQQQQRLEIAQQY